MTPQRYQSGSAIWPGTQAVHVDARLGRHVDGTAARQSPPLYEGW